MLTTAPIVEWDYTLKSLNVNSNDGVDLYHSKKLKRLKIFMTITPESSGIALIVCRKIVNVEKLCMNAQEIFPPWEMQISPESKSKMYLNPFRVLLKFQWKPRGLKRIFCIWNFLWKTLQQVIPFSRASSFLLWYKPTESKQDIWKNNAFACH